MGFLPQSRKEKKILFLLMVLLLFIGMEIFFAAKYADKQDSNFRAFSWDSKRLWKLKPSFSGRAWKNMIQTNSVGLRGREEYSLPHSNVRVISFGDSRTFGFNVADHETYSAIAQKKLHEAGIDAQVINAGVHGYSAVQCRLYLEEMLQYQPDFVVFAPGYNDRRYLVVRPGDSAKTFGFIARVKKITSVLEWSNTFFAFFYEIGQKKLHTLKQNPPPLNEVSVRVSEGQFKHELELIAQICRKHDIQPIFLKIYNDPSAYGIAEEAIELYYQNQPAKALKLFQENFDQMSQHVHLLGRYYMGLCLLALDEPEKANELFAKHEPLGSIVGEAVLRSERRYYRIFDEVAEEHSIPVIDGRNVIVSQLDGGMDAFPQVFIDECHYNADGHFYLGRALADTIQQSATMPFQRSIH